MTVRQWLRLVWGVHRPPVGGHFALAWKQGDTWSQKILEGDLIYAKKPRRENLYFCPNVFKTDRRSKHTVLPSRWLYADLDEVDPRDLVNEVSPTVAWETSPGRYQCMWLLTRAVKPKLHGILNKKMTVLTHADANGWGASKVLRVPGSLSTKHEAPFLVRQMWCDLSIVFKPERVARLTRHISVETNEVQLIRLNLPDTTPKQILKKYDVSRRTRMQLAKQDVRPGGRSEVLWRLENELIEAGLTPEETFVVVRASGWNKYKGQRREVEQLWGEVLKCASKHERKRSSKRAGDSAEEPTALRLTTYKDFRARTLRPPRWMVEGIWSEDAHGLCAGEEKSYKSLVAMDLGVSVASGTPFLGHYPVPQTGPVLLVQEENSAGLVQDRIMRIAASRGLEGGYKNGRVTLPKDLPMYFLNNAGFNLLDDHDWQWLEDTIQQRSLKLVILDPIYRLAPGLDENSAKELTPILHNLAVLKHKYDVGFLVVHHYKKQNPLTPIMGSARVSGSSVWGRWFESAIYIEKGKEHGQINLVPEHRSHPPQGMIHCEVEIGGEEDLLYSVQVRDPKSEAKSLINELKDIVQEDSGIPVADLCDELGVRRERVIRLAERAGLIVKAGPRGRKGPGRPGQCVYYRKSKR